MKYMLFVFRVALISAIWSVCNNAYSQENRCSDALVEDRVSIFDNEPIALSYYYLWSEKRFNKEKENIDKDTQAIIYGIPVESNTSYESFHTALDEKADIIEYNYNRDEAITYLTSGLKSENVDNWLECLHFRKENLILWVVDLEEDTAVIKIKYTTPRNVTGSIGAKPSLQNIVSESLSSLEGTWDNNREHAISVKRESNGEKAFFTLSVGTAITKTVSLPAAPKPALEKLDCSLSTSYTLNKQCPSGASYVGPNVPGGSRGHGGSCLTAMECKVETKYIQESGVWIDAQKYCKNSYGKAWVYAGLNLSSMHGGHCVRIVEDEFSLEAKYIQAGSVFSDGQSICRSTYGREWVYAGPNAVARHGGTCLKLIRR